MKFLFFVDAPEKIQIAKDTSFAFMEESQRRGHEIYCLKRGGVIYQEGKIFFRICPIKVDRKKVHFIEFGILKTISAQEADAVFIRLEPPFHTDYLTQTWLLDLAAKDCFIIPSPQGIRNSNEKISAMRFSHLQPATLVAKSEEVLLHFLQAKKKIIAKPLDAFGGSSIFALNVSDSNAKVILEVLSANFSKEIILQEYIPAAKKGDKRILLLNGEILGAVLRVPKKGEHRANFFAGGTAQETNITEQDKKIVAEIAPYLKKENLYFSGIDILGDYLIEINVTSPTCIQEASFFAKDNLSAKVLDFVEKKVKMFDK